MSGLEISGLSGEEQNDIALNALYSVNQNTQYNMQVCIII
jgi:dihydroorotate dehydrogenase